jgi:hypothetical protein
MSTSDTSAVPILFIGRIIQAISGSATWIASFAMLVENAEPERRGQTLALAMAFITCGTVSGPAVAGTVFQLSGYWAAWSVPIALLGLDSIARLLMVESESEQSPLDNTDEDCPECPASPQESDSLLNSPTATEGYKTMQQPLSKTAITQVTIRSVSSSNSFRDPWSDEPIPLPTPVPTFYRTLQPPRPSRPGQHPGPIPHRRRLRYDAPFVPPQHVRLGQYAGRSNLPRPRRAQNHSRTHCGWGEGSVGVSDSDRAWLVDRCAFSDAAGSFRKT